jgi:hypothetical protein
LSKWAATRAALTGWKTSTINKEIEMDFTAILEMLVAKFPIVGLVLSVLGALVVVGQVVVVATPSKEDDAAWEKIKSYPIIGPLVSALALFAPFQKK